MVSPCAECRRQIFHRSNLAGLEQFIGRTGSRMSRYKCTQCRWKYCNGWLSIPHVVGIYLATPCRVAAKYLGPTFRKQNDQCNEHSELSPLDWHHVCFTRKWFDLTDYSQEAESVEEKPRGFPWTFKGFFRKWNSDVSSIVCINRSRTFSFVGIQLLSDVGKNTPWNVLITSQWIGSLRRKTLRERHHLRQKQPLHQSL